MGFDSHLCLFRRQENGKEQTQTQTGPGSDAETEEGEEENSDEAREEGRRRSFVG